MTSILILYYSQHGTTQALARLVAHGVESVTNTRAVLRTVPEIKAGIENEAPFVQDKELPKQGSPWVSLADLAECDGLVLGSPTYFGNMAAPLKYFFDQTTLAWVQGSLVGKPAGVFTSTGSMHGGQEATLLSMMLPLLHHGMLICGVPYTEPALNRTHTGGTPYGPSHYCGEDNLPRAIDENEAAICHKLGQRIAETAQRLFN